MRRAAICAALVGSFMSLACGAAAPAAPAAPEQVPEVREELFAIERESHQQWLRGDVAALDELMAESFHFVAMNGAVEAKAEVVGSDGAAPAPRPLRIERLEVEPDKLLLDGGTAAVLSLLHIDASVAGRRLPERMRILSVFVRDRADGPWRLFARSITPILAPPAP
jgi:hypothetical protein